MWTHAKTVLTYPATLARRFCYVWTLLTLSAVCLNASGHMPGELKFQYSLSNLSAQEQVASAAAEQGVQLAKLMPPTCKPGEVGCKPKVQP